MDCKSSFLGTKRQAVIAAALAREENTNNRSLMRRGDRYPIKMGTNKHAEKYDPNTSQISLKLPLKTCAITMAKAPTKKMEMRLERITFLKRLRKKSKLSVLEAMNKKEFKVDKMMAKIPATKNPFNPIGSSWTA